MARIEKLDRGANAWAVGRFDALAGNARLPEQVSAQIPPLTWFEAAGHVNGGLRGTLRAETKDDDLGEEPQGHDQRLDGPRQDAGAGQGRR